LLSKLCQSKDVALSKIGGQETDLHTVSCGTLPPNPLELLSSAQFKDLLAQLRTRFKYIVIDSPPILAVSDAVVLGQMADSIIFSIKAEATTVKMAREALSRLQKGSVKVTGAVLTQAVPHRMSYYGKHYYHTSNYYGYKPSKADEAA
jgi:Mrp family chromosome partitioning ATPase